jgi:hypothetical protein
MVVPLPLQAGGSKAQRVKVDGLERNRVYGVAVVSVDGGGASGTNPIEPPVPLEVVSLYQAGLDASAAAAAAAAAAGSDPNAVLGGTVVILWVGAFVAVLVGKWLDSKLPDTPVDAEGNYTDSPLDEEGGSEQAVISELKRQAANRFAGDCATMKFDMQRDRRSLDELAVATAAVHLGQELPPTRLGECPILCTDAPISGPFAPMLALAFAPVLALV